MWDFRAPGRSETSDFLLLGMQTPTALCRVKVRDNGSKRDLCAEIAPVLTLV